MKEVAQLNQMKVDPQTVEMLTDLLNKAKAGELQSVVFVDKYHDNAVGHGWSGQPCKRMMGEIEDVKFNFFSQMYFPAMDEDPASS